MRALLFSVLLGCRASAPADGEPVYTPVSITFDDCSGEVPVDSRYEDVTFTTEEGYHFFCWDNATYSRTPPYTALTTRTGGGVGARIDLSWDFTTPVRALRFYSMGEETEGTLALVRVFTEAGDQGEVDLVGDGVEETAELTDLSAWDDIVRIEITEMEDAASVNYDDISFERRD